MDLKWVHAQNENIYVIVSMNYIFICSIASSSWEWSRSRKKVIQFVSFFMLFSKGKPMTNYEDFRHFYDFLKLKSNLKKH
jgi:hypothetical protein